MDKESNYNKILFRMKKIFLKKGGLFIIIRLYLTNNIFYYTLCIFFRFIPLITISIDFNFTVKNNNCQSFQHKIKLLTCYNLSKQINISFNIYIIICLIFFIEFIFRIKNYIIIILGLRKKNYINQFPSPSKYQIILDHIVFLLFPYIIEFLSFSYYIYFFPNKFFIKYNNELALIVIIIILNTILIIGYNINNLIIILCSNKIYITNEEEAFSRISRIKNENVFSKNKPILYRISNFTLYLLIILQNFSLFITIENYLSLTLKIYYEIIMSFILFLIIIPLLIIFLNNYNYKNFINSFINICIIYCFYNIIIDSILFILRFRKTEILNEIIYVLLKILLSYFTNILINIKVNKSLEDKINVLLFQGKKEKIDKNFIDALIYLNEIMIKIKGENNIDTNMALINFIFKHINNCNKKSCNCKLLKIFLQNEEVKELEKNQNEIMTNNLLIILNYLFESVFLEYNYYSSNDLTILLAEHFCHLRDNPVMAFSLINTVIIKNNNKNNRLENNGLYELSHKYINYIDAKDKLDKGFNIIENSFLKNNRKEYYLNLFKSLKISIKVKSLLNKYIDVLNKILKFKNLFSEGLSFKLDDNNELIDSVKINFFEQKSTIDDINNNKNEKTKQKESKKLSNLSNVIQLLKNEELYYNNIINIIKNIDFITDFPIFIIYKYYIFFDIIEGHQIPAEISNKIYLLFSNNQTNYMNITNKIYNLLKIRYNEQNNNINSKFCAIYEYKNDLTIKYFSEEFALRLGYTQKEIINEKIDKLMPIEFCKSHQNIIKKMFLEDQMKYYNLQKSYAFNANKTVIYPIEQKNILLYNFSRNLVILSESTFLLESEYSFMLNNNFDIIAMTKNFEYEYLLNQEIFHLYDLKILDILQIKSNKLCKKFENEFRIINNFKSIRQIKTEEYLIPQLYASKEDENKYIFKPNNFNHFKNLLLSNIYFLNESTKNNENEYSLSKEENEKLLKTTKMQNKIMEYFINPRKIIIHKQIKYNLNKLKFIENIFKELTKVSDVDNLTDKENYKQNLIFKSKKLITKLLTKNELTNDVVKICVKFSYYYDKPYYFIYINDEKKEYLKEKKYLFFRNNDENHNTNKSFINNNIANTPSNKKTRNKNIPFKLNKTTEKKLVKNNINSKNLELEYDKGMRKTIKKYSIEINKERFILIIKIILIFIIIFIFIVHTYIIYFQRNSINIIEKITLASFYNSHIRGNFFNILSKMNGVYHDISGICPINLSSSHFKAMKEYAEELRNNYNYFRNYFIEYHLKLGESMDILYKNYIFKIIKGYWKESDFNSDYSIEMEYLIYLIHLINDQWSPEFESDIKHFLFYKGPKNLKERVYTNFMRTLFYMTVNYDFSFKEIFNEINKLIGKSYSDFISKSNIIYYSLEISGLLLYLIFFFTIFIFLYNSNMIIIKNIIFLFLDFSEENKEIHNSNEDIIKLKLLSLKNIINDFNMNELQKYYESIDVLNNKQYFKEEELSKIFEDKNMVNYSNNNSKNKNLKEINKKFSIENKAGNKENNNFQNNKDYSKQYNNPYSNNDTLQMKSNNSSYNSLLVSDSNNIKNNLNNTNLFHNKGNLNKNPLLKTNNSNNMKNENQVKDKYQDAILNKSNKKIIPFIKKYIIITLILTIIIIIYIIYSIINNINYTIQSNYFYNDFKILSTRYINLYSYFNTLKSIMIFNQDDIRWKHFSEYLDGMNNFLDKSDREYNEMLAHKVRNYKEVSKLKEILQNNKKDIKDYLKNNLCNNGEACINYVDSEDNIAITGINIAYKTCFTFMNNILLNYKQIENKTNVNEIISHITGDEFYELKRIRKSFTNIFYNVQKMIYYSFEEDERAFREKYKRDINVLNISSVLFSILICLLNIFSIFISIRNFIKPIKTSVYKINNSFYYIKKYSISSGMKK